MDVDRLVKIAKFGVREFKDEHQPVFLLEDRSGAVTPFVEEDMGRLKAEVASRGCDQYWSITVAWVTETEDFRKQIVGIQGAPSLEAVREFARKVEQFDRMPSDSEFRKSTVVMGRHSPGGSDIWLMPFSVDGGSVVFGSVRKIDQKGAAFIGLNVWAPRQFTV